MNDVFHAGEIAVQTRAGVRHQSERVGNGIHAAIPDAARDFLAAQPFVVMGAQDESGAVWACALFGTPGFAHAVDEHTVVLAARPQSGDPLAALLMPESDPLPVGLLAIEPATRRRMRLNGNARRVGNGVMVSAREVYANCPKYITARPLAFAPGESAPHLAATASTGTALTGAQTARIARADTFFIASVHIASVHAGDAASADASHRGGNPGFVRVVAPQTLLFPDYSGNQMFNTLGNLAADERAGLLFLDFADGDLLHLSGTARVLWDDARQADFPGAQRLVEFRISAVIDRPGASPLRSTGAAELSRFNPD